VSRLKLTARLFGVLGRALFVVLVMRKGAAELAATVAAAGAGRFAVAAWPC